MRRRRIDLADVCAMAKRDLGINAWYGLSENLGGTSSDHTWLIGEMQQGRVQYWLVRNMDGQLHFRKAPERPQRTQRARCGGFEAQQQLELLGD